MPESPQDGVVLGSGENGDWFDLARRPDPDLPDSASEEARAKYEELDAANVTDATIDAICGRLIGIEEIDRLTARRFAVANNGDVDKSVMQMMESLKYLGALKESPLNDPLFHPIGFDLKGHPVVLWDGLKHKQAERSNEEVQNLIMSVTDQVYRKSKAIDGKVVKITMVLWIPPGSECSPALIKNTLQALQKYQPELFYRVVIFPTIRLGRMLWGVFSKCLNQRTAAKVQMMESTSPAEMLELVPAKLLKDYWGTEVGQETRSFTSWFSGGEGDKEGEESSGGWFSSVKNAIW